MERRARRSEPHEEPGLFDAPAPAAPARPAREADAPPQPPQPPLFTVSQLSARVQGQLQALGRVRVEGEVSQRKRTAAGHVYFDLKDTGAKLACKIWQSQVSRVLRFELEEGAKVIAWGRLDLYAPQGGYSLIVDRMEPLGLGALLAQLEQRKAELKALGWFERKRELPRFPRTIGLVTSRDGAALRDVLRTRSLRWPGYPLRLVHTTVQGPGAAESIAAALRALDASGVDVIALVRGGGSLEDLWAFNELAVAEAVWNASVPVVTGVGHETDTTLADLVADRRAHTPTDAAQTLIPDKAELAARFARLGSSLSASFARRWSEREERLTALATRPVLRDAGWILDERARSLTSLHARLDGALANGLERRRTQLSRLHARLGRRTPASELARRAQRLATASLKLAAGAARAVERRGTSLGLAARALEGVSPLAVLARGYAIARKPGALEALTDARHLAPGDEVETRLARGAFRARVESVEPPADDGAGAGPAGS